MVGLNFEKMVILCIVATFWVINWLKCSLFLGGCLLLGPGLFFLINFIIKHFFKHKHKMLKEATQAR